MLAQNHPDQPTVIVGNYTIFTKQLLGKGSTGSVFRGMDNVTNQNTIATNNHRVYPSVRYQPFKKGSAQVDKLKTRQSVSKEQENRQVSNGFVSYHDFMQTYPRWNNPRLVPPQRKVPQECFHRRSVQKQIPRRDSYMYNIFRQPQNSKRNVSVQTNLEYMPVASEKDNEQFNHGQNAAFSMRRQVTVRYL